MSVEDNALPEPPAVTTLRSVCYSDLNDEPEPWVLDMLEPSDMDAPVTVEERDPRTLVDGRGTPLSNLVRLAKKEPHASHVAHFRTNPGEPFLVNGSVILDGNHRAMADLLARRMSRVVDIAQLGY